MRGDIERKLENLRKNNETGLIIYLTAGFPSLNESMRLIQQTAECGADLIEIGIPFSDPVADGASIQYASEIALRNGVTPGEIISAIKSTHLKSPLIIMSYINPIIAYGRDNFFYDIKSAGVSGLVIPDLPVEESDEWLLSADRADIDMVFLITPVSPLERIKLVAQKTRGFIYCVSTTGTTGVRNHLSQGLSRFLKNVRKNTTKPIAVGFGISSAEHIKLLRNDVDAVIVGSRIIECLRRNDDLEGIIKAFKDATRKDDQKHLIGK